MSRRKKRNDIDLSDITFMATTRVGGSLAIALGIVGVCAYHFFEPSYGDPTNPITSMGHIFWEATAVRFYWPFVALIVFGIVGLITSTIITALSKRH